jgi:hypothetical protein
VGRLLDTVAGSPSAELRSMWFKIFQIGSRRPERYAMPKHKSVADVKDELRSVLASELASWEISYPRSNGSAWTLALKDVIYRATDRDEGSTCKRHASSAQRVKMTSTARGSTNDVGQERV